MPSACVLCGQSRPHSYYGGLSVCELCQEVTREELLRAGASVTDTSIVAEVERRHRDRQAALASRQQMAMAL